MSKRIKCDWCGKRRVAHLGTHIVKMVRFGELRLLPSVRLCQKCAYKLIDAADEKMEELIGWD